MIYTYEELCKLPTLHQGHFADLKVDTGDERIWLSRMTIQDGELDPVQVEALRNGCWVDVTNDPNYYRVQGQACRAGVRTNDGHWLRRGSEDGDKTT